MKNRIAAIDILKAVSIVAVILIHTTSISYRFLKPEELDPYITLDNFLRFSVPLFVALSGYLLAAKYLKKTLSLSEFFLKRAFKLIPTYLVWTTIIYFYLHYFTKEPQQQYSLFEIIFLGKADYHLYFVPMLFQLYLLFPLLLFIYKKSRWFTLALTLALQLGVFAFSQGIRDETIKVNFLWGDQQQYIFCLTWIFYFVLGIFLLDYKSKINTLIKVAFPFLTVFTFMITLNQSFAIFEKTKQLLDATTFVRYTIVAYASAFIATAVFISNYLELIPSLIKNTISEIGKSSYTIYLMHTIVLRIVFEKMVSPDKKELNLILFPILVITISVITSVLINRVTGAVTNQLAFSKAKPHH